MTLVAISYFHSTLEPLPHVCSCGPRVFLDYVAEIWGAELPERTFDGNDYQNVTREPRQSVLSVSVRASSASSLSTCVYNKR